MSVGYKERTRLLLPALLLILLACNPSQLNQSAFVFILQVKRESKSKLNLCPIPRNVSAEKEKITLASNGHLIVSAVRRTSVVGWNKFLSRPSKKWMQMSSRSRPQVKLLSLIFFWVPMSKHNWKNQLWNRIQDKQNLFLKIIKKIIISNKYLMSTPAQEEEGKKKRYFHFLFNPKQRVGKK